MARMRVTIVAVALLLGMAVAAKAQNQPAAIPATPDNVASFLGVWTITATGSYGNATVTLTLKAAEGKIVGEAEDTNGKHPLGDDAAIPRIRLRSFSRRSPRSTSMTGDGTPST